MENHIISDKLLQNYIRIEDTDEDYLKVSMLVVYY